MRLRYTTWSVHWLVNGCVQASNTIHAAQKCFLVSLSSVKNPIPSCHAPSRGPKAARVVRRAQAIGASRCASERRTGSLCLAGAAQYYSCRREGDSGSLHYLVQEIRFRAASPAGTAKLLACAAVALLLHEGGRAASSSAGWRMGCESWRGGGCRARSSSSGTARRNTTSRRRNSPGGQPQPQARQPERADARVRRASAWLRPRLRELLGGDGTISAVVSPFEPHTSRRRTRAAAAEPR